MEAGFSTHPFPFRANKKGGRDADRASLLCKWRCWAFIQQCFTHGAGALGWVITQSCAGWIECTRVKLQKQNGLDLSFWHYFWRGTSAWICLCPQLCMSPTRELKPSTSVYSVLFPDVREIYFGSLGATVFWTFNLTCSPGMELEMLF